ncbi:carbohydrate-binding module family 18 protein [Cercospora zeae-maydis SCOH1-5]|uniref:chitinase n=1 Tax=Cercospora zeae-maydis SCOH1-5 TaxID=717836 RepID=A0A6A6EYZ0_9PEZI|nr:carbohydrate-binding module family 18 protein [Cercospora zeae-maydis SCOH1-5]
MHADDSSERATILALNLVTVIPIVVCVWLSPNHYGWCGVTEDYCSSAGAAPCQTGFGSCEVQSAFKCDPAKGSAVNRGIGYYQGSNVYSNGRLCNQIRPMDIAPGYTHLYWAFAEFDPSTFAVAPSDQRDLDLYKSFTDLQHQRTWSHMVATPASRHTFIDSLVSFMQTHGFEGVDLDWEYPVSDKRGGSKDDMVNLKHPLAEMRAFPAFGHNFGVSVTLAPDLWYLQHFGVKGLLANADFLGFMSYDLHGTWDADVPQIGKQVLGHTNIKDIEKDLIPLWFDLEESDMQNLNIELVIGSKATNLVRVPLLKAFCPPPRFKALIAEKRLTPEPLGTNSMMKQITWDDQWMEFDDEETILEKIKYANEHCFGGTKAWSVDLDSGTGFCGSSDAYCGAGCYSGNCKVGEVTSDGSCGVGNSYTTCGGAFPGCCSALGFCGPGDAYCNNQQSEFSSNSSGGGNKGIDHDPPGDPTTWPRPWESVTCDYKDLPNDGADPALRWQEAQADLAWRWAVRSAPGYVENPRP